MTLIYQVRIHQGITRYETSYGYEMIEYNLKKYDPAIIKRICWKLKDLKYLPVTYNVKVIKIAWPEKNGMTKMT